MQILFPSFHLQAYIQHYFFPVISEKNIKESTGKLEVFPSPTTSLIFFISEPSFLEQNGALKKYDDFVLIGYYKTPKYIIRHSQLRQMIIRFTPLGIQWMLNFSLSELTDKFASVESVFNEEFKVLQEKLSNCYSNEERVRCFEQFFIKKLSKINNPIDRRVLLLCKYINLTKGTKSLKDVSKYSGLGERTVQRLINNYIGINFKLFSRLVRFNSVRESLSKIDYTADGRDINFTDLAYKHNYFDQAHFIHDFKDISNLSPIEYKKRIDKHKLVDLPNLINVKQGTTQ